MGLTIDQLNIELTANSKEVSSAIEDLIKIIDRLQAALAPIANINVKINNSVKNVTKNVNKTSSAMNEYAEKTEKAGKSTQSFAQRLAQKISTTRTLVSVFQNAADKMAGAFNESNEYIETLNLFNVTMGEGAEKAREFAESVSALTGIDTKEWMQYQGVFKNLTAGFGIASDKANIMSQNLTQLSYDMASFFNTDVEKAFDKLSSAMSGQVKGLREFGIDTTVASLQEYALAQGIDAKVRSMSQAEKSLLRYNYIMEKSIIMQGDMARTIITPANALRILSAQLTQMKRALGNVVSVIAVQFIPYVQVMVQMITNAATALANFFGFELPEIDYSGLDTGGFAGGFEDAEESLDGVSGKLKKIKKQLMGFDELNIINDPKSDSGSGSSGASGGGAGLDLKPLEYDFLAGLKTDKLDEIKEKLNGILTVVGLISAGVLAWNAYKFWQDLDLVQKRMVGLTLMITGFALEFDGAKEIGNGTAGLWDYIKTAIGAGLGIAGSLIVFGTGPLGWAIGIGAALTVFLTGFAVGYNEKQLREDMEKRFGEISLSVEQMKDYAEKLTTTDLSLKIDLYIEEAEMLDKLKKKLEDSFVDLQGYSFRVKAGLEIDQSSYEIAVDNYVQQATEYLTQKQIVALLSVDILLGGTEAGEGLSDFATSFYTTQQQQLSDLGQKLKNTVSEGFKDGVWIEDKLEEAIKLQTEIQEILNYVSDVEYQAKINAIKLDAKTLDMDAESFKGILEQAENTIAEKMDALEGIRLENLKIAQMQYDQNILNGMAEAEAKNIYDSAVSAAQKAFEDGKLELNYGTIDFGVQVLQDKFATELEKATPVLGMTVQDVFESGLMQGASNPEEIYERPLEFLINELQNAYGLKIGQLDISSAARKNIESLVAELQPSKAQYQEIADAAIKAGKTVPEEVVKGLSDIAQLEAIKGSLGAQSYLIGEMLSTDKSFLDTLATAENAGKDINTETARGLMANLQVVEDAANGTITLINDTIGEKTYEITPTLVENLKTLGVDLTDGLYDGVEEENNKKKSLWEKICGWFGSLFAEKNEIHSPSKLFKGYGGNIIQGLWDGLSSAWNELKSWWEKLSLSSPYLKTPHLSWTSTPASGWMANVLDALGLPTSLPKLNVSWYADGGFPNMGEMFIARESGPELVGSIGRKTAVANNDQIVSSLENGVYRAMMAANATKQGGTQTIRIINEIDGDVVGEKVIQYHNGKVLQTGVSPLLV